MVSSAAAAFFFFAYVKVNVGQEENDIEKTFLFYCCFLASFSVE